MSRTKHILFSACLALTAAGCSNDDSSLPSQSVTPVALTIETDVEGADTRAEKTSFSEGDVIYVTGRVGDEVQGSANLKYIRQGEDADALWAAADEANTFYYASSSAVAFSASYLCNQDFNLSEDGTLVTGLRADDAHEHDFLFASGAIGTQDVDNGKVYFDNTNNDGTDARFKHVMSKIIFTIEGMIANYDEYGSVDFFDNPFTSTPISGVTFKLAGLKTTGTLNLQTGVAAATSDSEIETITGEILETTDTKVKGCVYIFPQSGAGDLIVTIGQFKYKYTLPATDYRSGYYYERSVYLTPYIITE